MKFYVEITVCAEISAEDISALTDRICNDGWTVFTLLDEGAVSGPIIVRDRNNDQVAEL